MAKIQADNQAIKTEIEKQLEMVYDHGGWINPDLLIRIEDGELSMEMPQNTENTTVILNVPTFLLVPTTIMDVTIKDNAFVFSADKDFPDVKREMAERLFNLYNLTDKAANYRKNSFWLGMAEVPALMDKVTSARTLGEMHEKWKKTFISPPPEAEFNKVLAEAFLKTRVLGTAGRNQDRRLERRGALMPLIDILNHNINGASFTAEKHGSRRCLAVRNRQPIEGNNECFAVYGIMDALDTFLRYDFIDRHAPFVRSIPLCLEVGDLGVLDLKASPGAFAKGVLPPKMEPYRSFMPLLNGKESGHLTVSHLLVTEGAFAPTAFRRILAWCIGTLAGQKLPAELMTRLVLETEEKILKANKDYYRSLLAEVEAVEGNFRIISPLRELAELQLEKLGDYQPVEVAA